MGEKLGLGWGTMNYRLKLEVDRGSREKHSERIYVPRFIGRELTFLGFVTNVDLHFLYISLGYAIVQRDFWSLYTWASVGLGPHVPIC